MNETKITISNKKARVELPLSTAKNNKAIVVDSSGKMALQTLSDTGGGGGDITFDGDRPITRGIPGLQGIIPGGSTVVEVLDNMLYPAVAPQAALQASNPVREYGESPAVTLTWSVTPQTNPITSINVNGIAQDIAETSGSQSATTPVNTDTSFTMSVTTEGESAQASTQVVYRKQGFWFQSGEDLLGYSDAQLSAFLNALPGSRKQFSTQRAQDLRTFTLNNEYSYFVYSNELGDGSFSVNGLNNNAYQPKTFTYTNSYGYQNIERLYRSGSKATGTVEVKLN